MCWKCSKPGCLHRHAEVAGSIGPESGTGGTGRPDGRVSTAVLALTAQVRAARVKTTRVKTALAASTLLATTLATSAMSGTAAAADVDSVEGVSPNGASSDLLIVLDADGNGYTAQHTLFSNGALLSLTLPDGVVADEVRFGGPERRTFATAWERSPSRLALWSGSALVRYRHRFSSSLIEESPGEFSLVVPSVPERLRIEDGQLNESAITWLLPAGSTLEGYTAANGSSDGWRTDENVLSYKQPGGRTVTLGISWRQGEPPPAICDEPCPSDIDRDGIPDERDVCLPSSARSVPEVTEPVDSFGCPFVDGQAREALELDDIRFASGQSYLDLAARRQLDRLVRALPTDESSIFEIGAHTDRIGKTRVNLRLSEQRAKAVRHYLMLRGVSPNRLRATGYGETRPLEKAGTREAARANRRIEIRRLD